VIRALLAGDGHLCVAIMQGQNLDELFDVVDENDLVVGQSTRREVHAQKLLHRAVHVLVVNERGSVFLQKRSEHKDTHPGALSTSCAGHVDSGEDYDDTVPRELQEELGLDPATLPPREKCFKLGPCRETGWEFIWVYKIEHEGPFELNEAEVESGLWLSPKAIDSAVKLRSEEFTPSFVLIWKKWRADGR
jgi:isopentenyl-diphosphate delta-isomerase